MRINTHVTRELYLNYFFFACVCVCVFQVDISVMLCWCGFFCFIAPVNEIANHFLLWHVSICVNMHVCERVLACEMMRAALIKILNIRLCYCFWGLLCFTNICWLKAHHVRGPVNPWLTCKCRHSLFIHFYPNINGTRLYRKPELKQMARFSLRPHSWHFLDLLCMWIGCREFRCN